MKVTQQMDAGERTGFRGTVDARPWLSATLSLLAALAFCFPTTSARAESSLAGYGPTLAFSASPDQFLVGGFIEAGGAIDPIRVLGFFDVGLGDNLTTVALGPSVVAMISFRETGRAYAGLFGGLNYSRVTLDDTSDSKSTFSLAVNAGAILPLRSNALLLDLKVGWVDHADAKLLVGYHVRSGK